MPDPSKNSGRIRRFFQRLVPRHGGAKASNTGTRSRPFGVSEGNTQAQRQPGVTTPMIQIDISHIPEVVRPELGLPPHVPVLHVDPEDWAIVQRNFIAPLGHPFDPDDPEKPEEFAPRSHRRALSSCCFSRAPQYPWSPGDQESTKDDKETTPPSYKWAAVSVLPQPTEITNWSAIFAAQREMSRLLEIQSYIETRIAEIKSQCIERLKERVRMHDIPTWQLGYLEARMLALLSPIVRLTENRDPGDGDLNRLTQEMTKVLFVRERLSPVSFLSFQGSAGDGDDAWGWNRETARLFEEGWRLAGNPHTRSRPRLTDAAQWEHVNGGGATVTQIYDHEATF